MTFSRQDARFEPTIATLDGYSAADMMADLGTHRRVALPLAGRALVIAPPPPNINKHGPRLARLAKENAAVPDAWGALYDPALAEERDDGLGEGQMHRTGPNYLPGEPRQRMPPRTVRHARSLLQLGKFPERLPHRRAPDSSRVARKIIERRGHSRDRFEGPPGDILAPLRLEPVMSDPRSRAPRGPAAIVGHHLSGNSPIAMRAISLPSHISSRIVPDNPNVSHWNVGKLATARGGYDYMQPTPKKLIISPSPALVQAREVNKINYAAPVASPANLSTISIAPVKNRGPPRFTATRPAPPIPSGSVLFVLPGQNAGDKSAGTGESYTEGETESVVKSQELIGLTIVPDTVPSTTEPATMPQATLTSEMSPTSDFSDKFIRRTSVTTHYPPSVKLNSEAEAYLSKASEVLNYTYVEESANNTESESSGHCNRPASGKDVEVATLELLHRDFYSLRKAVDKLKARITGFDDFENSLKGRIVKIRQLKKGVLNEIEREEKDMRGIQREIHAMRMKHIRVVDSVRAESREEEVVHANVEPGKLPVWKDKLSSPSSVEAMGVESPVVDAESTIRVKRGKRAKHDIPMWIQKTDNRTSFFCQSLEVKPEVQGEGKASSDTKITSSLPTVGSTSTKKEQMEKHHIVYHTKGHLQAAQTLKEQPTKENTEVLWKEPVEKEQKEGNGQLQVLSEAEMSEKRPEKGLIESGEFVKKCAVVEENFKNRVVNEQLPKNNAAKSELHQQAEILDQEKPENVIHIKKRQAETTRAEEQPLPKTEADSTAMDVMEGTPEGTPLKIQSDLSKDRKQARKTVEALKQEWTERLQDKGKPQKRERERERDRDKSECLRHLRLKQAYVTQEEGKKVVKEREQTEKVYFEEENLNQQRRARELHDKARTEAHRLRLDEEKLVRDHLALVKLQEKLQGKRRADEKARDEMALLRDPKLHRERRFAEMRKTLEEEQSESVGGPRGDHEIFERFTDRVELVELGRNKLGKSEEAVEGGKPQDMGLKKATVGDYDSNGGQPTVKVVKQQKDLIDPKPILNESASPPPVTNAKGKVIFPYKIDLDLRPIFDYPPLRVKIQQFGKPEDAIIKDCKDLLTPAQFEELYKMPHFQDFLINCNDRHSIKMARYYVGAGNH